MSRITALALAMVLTAGCLSTPTAEEPAARWLASIVIPEVDFREVALSDLIEFITVTQASRGGVPDRLIQRIEGVNVVYSFRVSRNEPDGSPASIAETHSAVKSSFVQLGPRITFQARYISLYDLLVHLVEEAGGTLEIKGDQITIRARSNRA